MKKYEVDKVKNRLLVDGKAPKKVSDQDIKDWIIQEISIGASLEDLHLVGENNLPTIGTVMDWREDDTEFYIDIKDAEKKRNVLLIEKYQSRVLKYLQNPDRESKSAIDALEKLVSHMSKI